MNMKNLYLCFLLFSLAATNLYAQEVEEEYDPSLYEAEKVKSFCNNKVLNLSPSNLLSVSYDAVLPFDMESVGNGKRSSTAMGLNHGLRIETNYPIISKSNIIVNLYANYWQSSYASAASFAEENQSLARNLNQHALRSAVLGALIFKPINEKKFVLLQIEPSLNGNYNFGDLSPNLGKMKYSLSALYGWKFDDNTNFAVGLTRTYRGGRVLHIPVVMYNKTFNERWGTELLLPARGALRYNFSVKSLLLLGYELEGQSYLLQSSASAPLNNFSPNNELELRKSEVRARIQLRKSITDFIWLDAQVGMRVAYRFDLDINEGSNSPILENNIGFPLYFRFGIALVSP